MGELTEFASGAGRGLGGLSRRQFAERAVKSKEVLLAAMGHSGHQHVNDHVREPITVLEEQVLLVAHCFVATWPTREKSHPVDVVAMAIMKCGQLEPSLIRRSFGGFPLESDLTAPTEAQLQKEGLRVAREVVVRDSRADLVGYGKAFFERNVIAVELKNASEACERLADYRRAADSVRVVMSPECLARTSLARGELAEPFAYAQCLSKMGAELWTLDSTTGESQRIKGVSSGAYVSADYESLWTRLAGVAVAA
ncbi:hypothetical protein HUW63_21425 [Myxococcus sp. AM001]|nr:hypothetical protein [Myxococcus sp. AM001]